MRTQRPLRYFFATDSPHAYSALFAASFAACSASSAFFCAAFSDFSNSFSFFFAACAHSESALGGQCTSGIRLRNATHRVLGRRYEGAVQRRPVIAAVDHVPEEVAGRLPRLLPLEDGVLPAQQRYR